MAEPRVSGLHSAELGVQDMAAAKKFFTDTWGLEAIVEQDGTIYLRGTGPSQYVIALHPRDRSELVRITLLADDREAVDALYDTVRNRNMGEAEAPTDLTTPGGGYGFTFKDPEGRNIRIATGIATHGDTDDAPDRPRKLSHVVLNAADPKQSIDMFTDLLRFKVSDSTHMMTFLRCGTDHHNIAVTHSGGGPTLHHIAFEMPDLESVMRGAGRCRENDTPVEWGVGRHGPGKNVFAYFVGPEGFPIEYTAEVMQVDDNYPTGGPDDWGFPNGRTDHWGITDPPTKRVKEAQSKIEFAATLA